MGMYQSAWRRISEHSRYNIKLLNSTGPFLRRNVPYIDLDEKKFLIDSKQWLPCFPLVLSFRNSLCCLASVLPQTLRDLLNSYIRKCPAQVEFCASCE